ncbi:aldo/keto reductase, partial [Rhizobium sp. AP16]
GGRLQPLQEPAVKAYLEIAAKHNLDPSKLAIAYCLTKPFMASVIIGATSIAQLETDIGAANVTLSEEVLAEIEKVHRVYPLPM